MEMKKLGKRDNEALECLKRLTDKVQAGALADAPFFTTQEEREAVSYLEDEYGNGWGYDDLDDLISSSDKEPVLVDEEVCENLTFLLEVVEKHFESDLKCLLSRIRSGAADGEPVYVEEGDARALSGVIGLLGTRLEEGDIDSLKKMLPRDSRTVSVWDALSGLRQPEAPEGHFGSPLESLLGRIRAGAADGSPVRVGEGDAKALSDAIGLLDTPLDEDDLDAL